MLLGERCILAKEKITKVKDIINPPEHAQGCRHYTLQAELPSGEIIELPYTDYLHAVYDVDLEKRMVAAWIEYQIKHGADVTKLKDKEIASVEK